MLDFDIMVEIADNCIYISDKIKKLLSAFGCIELYLALKLFNI